MGRYEKLDPSEIQHIYREGVVPDPDGLLNMVMNPSRMTAIYHATLLRTAVELGYGILSRDLAIGPVWDQDQKQVPAKMRLVNYERRPKTG